MAKKIGDVAREALIAGTSDEEALAAVLEEFPEAKTKIASIKWYRSQLRREVKEGKREAGGEGASKRRSSGDTSSGKKEMTPELAATLRENATKRRDEKHAKLLREQEERIKKRGVMPDQANMIRSAALRYRAEHAEDLGARLSTRFGMGFWPAPSDLIPMNAITFDLVPPER